MLQGNVLERSQVTLGEVGGCSSRPLRHNSVKGTNQGGFCYTRGIWRSRLVAYGSGLLNRRGAKTSRVGSNPTSSAITR